MTVNKAMSAEEREIFKKDVETALMAAMIRKYKPVITAYVGVILFAITTTWWFATNVATVKDIDKISVKVDALSERFTNDRGTHISLRSSIDSVAGVTTIIQNSLKGAYVTSYRDKTGVRFKHYE